MVDGAIDELFDDYIAGDACLRFGDCEDETDSVGGDRLFDGAGRR